jgi:hypothetical protein
MESVAQSSGRVTPVFTDIEGPTRLQGGVESSGVVRGVWWASLAPAAELTLSVEVGKEYGGR